MLRLRTAQVSAIFHGKCDYTNQRERSDDYEATRHTNNIR